MIPENFKPSLVVPYQLPSFIRDEKDYQVFVNFLQAYYEFLEQEGNVNEVNRNLLNYKDVDNTIDSFESYFFNEFLQDFPENSLTDKRELTKFSRELYQRKSTPASFKFLFRALFNSDSEVFNAKDYVLIASGGNWNRSNYLRLSTTDERFLQTKFLKIIGETSKSIAKIESVEIISNKAVVFISDIIRDFTPGEFIRIVDDKLKNVTIGGDILRAKLVGSIQKITVIPGYAGTGYKVGDPALVIGGLNPEKENPTKSTAEVSEVGLGKIQSINVLNGANGFREYPNTTIAISGIGSAAEARVATLDADNPAIVNNLLITDLIGPFANVIIEANTYGFTANTSANLLTEIISSFGVIDPIETYPISSVELISEGYGYDANTIIYANSYISFANTTYDISEFGILSPIKILYGGVNYSNGDEVLITGGSGFGAYANVSSVDINGKIERVSYINPANTIFTYGGVEYSIDNLPTITAVSSNNKILYLSSANTTSANTNVIYFANTDNVKVGMFVSGTGIGEITKYDYFDTDTTVVEVGSDYVQLSSNVSSTVSANTIYTFNGTSLLYVDSILGAGESFQTISEKIGEIKSIRILQSGEDYVSTPTVSLKVVDIALINVDENNLPEEGQIVYQTDAISSTFRAVVDSIEVISDEAIRTYRIRLYNFYGTLNTSEHLYIDETVTNSREIELTIRNTYSSSVFTNGVRFYGDGYARANAIFESSVISGTGQYLNSDGFLSYSNYLESKYINEYSYFLIVEEQFTKYKTLLHNILHPAGKQYVNFDYLKSNNSFEIEIYSEINKEIDLRLITRDEVYGILSEPSKLDIYELQKEVTGISLDGILSSNDYIHLESTNGEVFYSKISHLDNANDIIYLIDANILEYPNVAYGYVGDNNNIIITSLTGTFDLINNGDYTNSNNYLMDIVYSSDSIEISNNSLTPILSVDYSNNIIYANGTLYQSGNSDYPELISITRNFVSNTILVNYNTVYKYMLGYGNTATLISIDGFELLDEDGNLIYIPLKI